MGTSRCEHAELSELLKVSLRSMLVWERSVESNRPRMPTVVIMCTAENCMVGKDTRGS